MTYTKGAPNGSTFQAVFIDRDPETMEHRERIYERKAWCSDVILKTPFACGIDDERYRRDPIAMLLECSDH